MVLTPRACSLGVKMLTLAASLSKFGNACTNAIEVSKIEVGERLPSKDLTGYLWAVKPATLAPAFTEWQSLDIRSGTECLCEPAYPPLLWSVDKKTGVAVPSEDPKAAAIRERAIKNRCPIYHIEAQANSHRTRHKYRYQCIFIGSPRHQCS